MNRHFPLLKFRLELLLIHCFSCKTVEYCGSPEKEMSLNTTQHTVEEADRIS